MLVKFDNKNALKFISENQIKKERKHLVEAYNFVKEQTGEGNEFLGWLNYPNELDKEEYSRIKKAAARIRKNSDVLVVIGIGGSYLGAKAVISCLSEYFPTEKELKIIFVGNTLSPTYTKNLLDYLENLDFSINVVSKSGTTTEPAIAFRLFKDLLEKKYKDKAKERIFATTDKKVGALRTLSEANGYETFVVPDNIGGRYSWITAVGLLPICASGIDIDLLVKGASLAVKDFYDVDIEQNDILNYSLTRYLLNKNEKSVEVLVSYEPKLSYLCEWWKQLFGESEGKNGKGLFPSSLIYSTDLHSMGQFIQEGSRIMFETVINIKHSDADIIMQKADNNLDGLNYLAGEKMSNVLTKAMQGTVLAHVDGGVPNLMLEIAKLDEYNLGYLLYFFMLSCAVSCYLQGVNPFNQPGVEEYKRNMFALLGKPGYEELQKKLKSRLK